MKNTWQTKFVRGQLEASADIKKKVLESCKDDILSAAKLIIKSVNNGGKLLTCGNGGSAADAQHIATELVVRMEKERPGIKALALTTDTSLLTAMSNDYSFTPVFARQVETLGDAGDVLLAISTSGSSKNIIEAAKSARSKGLKVLVLTGKTGGDLKSLGDEVILVPSDDTQRIQEAHITVGHIICGLVERTLFPDHFE
ncbi:MAG: D-sedoheptulose 7-phosphate isomerase [Candidatus Marinimicrobia bacterium]|nr:D-sedoheptulose 7-phosphate isomerase [Candidatus Neomarinimicrobiota bacterium]MCF7827510.1 D-sedoheptulose 7-phosphate isomerase [Candidatus Neomarinimicrobiota bacterium]MCF7881628.1 D-sedoheptulose 7-phosphate isomerase [Candidatus Neomarinimicrobiota bacterium]